MSNAILGYDVIHLVSDSGAAVDVTSNETISVVVPPVDREFSYRVPAGFKAEDLLGCRVSVPFGKRISFGYVVSVGALSAENDDATIHRSELKSLVMGSRPVPCFTAPQLELFRWIARYYGEPLASIIDVAVPHIMPPVKESKAFLKVPANPEDLKQIKGAARIKAIETLTALGGAATISELRDAHGVSRAALKALEQRGLVEVTRVAAERGDTVTSTSARGASLARLNNEQSAAFDAIKKNVDSNVFGTFLLHGVTGSGKTEVYINLAASALAEGRGVLIIVPEIALTPQLIDRFRVRLGEDLSVLHSGVGQRPRWDSWTALLEGRTRLAIGARSAVFAPVKNLGLVVVDEEHDQSFKQSEGVRYHARDVAILRGKLSSCPVVLGSATPSLESYHLARTERYSLLPLSKRHSDATYPRFEVVDMNLVKPWELPSRSISPMLHEALAETLSKGQQAFLLYNRRGFASYLQCDKCALVLECPQCSVTLTYYQRRGSLLCHYCGFSTTPVLKCPVCSVQPAATEKSDSEPPSLSPRGAGTERVYDEVRTLFPTARVERLDRDVASSVDDYEEILDRVRAGETDIVVGTQLLAKGHDLPSVTLVGIIDCDVGLHMPDFRAGERVFQLLTQASGRAGRHTAPGRAILQTRVPRHPSIRFTLAHDYRGFASEELEHRRTFGYPPYTRLLRIIGSSVSLESARDRVTAIAKEARAIAVSGEAPVAVLGPIPAPLERLRSMWRWHLLIKSESAATLHRVLAHLRKKFKSNAKVRVIFDMDPQDMM